MKRLSILLSAAVVFSSISACAVLTPSQVGEVKKFARASEDYSAVPGALASSYGILLRNEKLLSLSRYSYGTDSGAGIDTSKSIKAWEEIKNAYALEHDFKGAGKRMDAALGVLKEYSKILTLLVSDEYTDSLGKSAVDLGKAVDAATDAYNDQYRSANPLTKVGGDIGQIVRGAGGIYVRHRQAEILKETVKKADPLIQALMVDVEDIALNRFKTDFINYENNALGRSFQSVANNMHQVDVCLVSAVYDDLARTRAGVELSDEVASAARAYAKAHHALLEKTRSRMHLKEAIEEIKALSKEVSAAKKTKKSIED
ncbi:MAG: hypothetical protein A2075_15210 [Geobacteraceae bacterium GWC2_58_44]|nr:MAG: hypothetical protein A2075_15210 [Geobacteraceae bacterium GWC2_58_44]HBG07301.1 hypothetical protein [Geobacter sp.]